MKKYLLKAFTCSLCVVFLFSMSVGFVVSDNNNQNLYILSEDCPQDIIDYTKEQFSLILNWESTLSGSVQIGQPFLLNNTNTQEKLYYFPIINDGKVISTYRVYMANQSYNGILSDALAGELNSFQGKTSRANPARIFVNKKNDIVIKTNSIQTIIDCNPTDVFDEHEIVEPPASRANEKEAKNILNPLVQSKASAIEPRGGQKTLNVTIRETQTNLPWCAGYVAAMITSYKTGGVYYARDVARFAGVGESSAISRSKVVKFAKSKGLSPRETIFNVSTNSLGKQIEKNSPVYVGAKNLSNTSESHALTVMGYSYDGDKSDVSGFSVWNPWYTSFEWMGANQIYVDRGGTRYQAQSYIINW